MQSFTELKRHDIDGEHKQQAQTRKKKRASHQSQEIDERNSASANSTTTTRPAYRLCLMPLLTAVRFKAHALLLTDASRIKAPGITVIPNPNLTPPEGRAIGQE